MRIYSIPFFLLIFLSLIMTGCDSESKLGNSDYSFKSWLKDKSTFFKIMKKIDLSSCEEAENIYLKIEGEEFKKKSLLPLSRCFIDNNLNEKALFYLKTAFEEGYNLKLIDSSKYRNIWRKIKLNYFDLNNEFWRKQDTSYFRQVESLVYFDQKVRYSRNERSPIYSDENTQDSISTNYLIEYCKKNGFPKIFYSSRFSQDRQIDPTILAIHSDDKNKLKLLSYAVKSASKQFISWLTPKTICKSFYVAGKKQNSENPLIFVFFKNDKLNMKKSQLGLYSIAELYNNDIPSSITIKPSKNNYLNKSIIHTQIKQIKKQLVEEYNFPVENIRIELQHSNLIYKDLNQENFLYTIKANTINF